MKALSLTQPWATLVAIGAKRIETRSWRCPYSAMGTRIAIHASKGFPRECIRLCATDPFRSALVDVEHLPFGAIVATARVLHCDPMPSAQSEVSAFIAEYGGTEHDEAFGDYTPGRFAWALREVRRLATPVECKGALGLWTVPDSVAREVLERKAIL